MKFYAFGMNSLELKEDIRLGQGGREPAPECQQKVNS